MRPFPLLYATALVAIVAGSLAAQQPQSAAKRAFQPADWYRVSRISSPVLSPDGSRIAFTVTSVRELENRRHDEVWMVPTTGGEAVRLTSTALESNAPCWSADGMTLYFTSTRDGRRGQYALRMNAPGEAFQPEGPQTYVQPAPAARSDQPRDGSFTASAGRGSAGNAPAGGGARGGGARGGGGGGCGGAGGRGGAGNANPEDADFVPAPFTGLSKEDLPSKIRALALPPCGAITKPEDSARFDGRHIVQANFRSNNGGYTVPSTNCGDGRGGGAGTGRGGRGIPPADSAVAPAAAGRGAGRGGAPGTGGNSEPAQIFIARGNAAPKQITNTLYSHSNVVVSPDGRLIAFTADAQLRPDSVVAATAEGRGGRAGGAGGGGGGRASRPNIDPQGKPLDPGRNDSEIYILPVAPCESGSSSCTPRKVEFDGAESSLAFSPDGKWIAFHGRPGGNRTPRLYVAPTSGGAAADSWGDWIFEPGSISWSSDNKIIVQVTTGGSNGIYKIDPATRRIAPLIGGDRQISGIQWSKDSTRIYFISNQHDRPGEIHSINADGTGERVLTNINGAVNSEVAWSAAERFTYKSVGDLEIEGWLLEPFGYEPGRKYPLVLYIHGGPHSAYGAGWFDEFQNLTAAGMWVLFTNPRGSSSYNGEFTNSTRGRWGAEDYEDLMKAVDIAAARPDVDSTRMGVTGGSYGGFMTAWITTKTNRFKAAQADRMISDWVSWWGSTDVQSLTNGEFFGRPWENLAMYDSLSPIRHVQNVRTPTLIVQSEEDHRTPIGNADLWFQALKALNVPVEYIRYPRSTHELSRSGEPWLLVDRLSRIRQWFSYWLIEQPVSTTGG